MGVSRAELQAVKLERQGDAEEAAKFRARAEKMRYEDPYTALQDELDEAVKNEVGPCVWALTLVFVSCLGKSKWWWLPLVVIASASTEGALHRQTDQTVGACSGLSFSLCTCFSRVPHLFVSGVIHQFTARGCRFSMAAAARLWWRRWAAAAGAAAAAALLRCQNIFQTRLPYTHKLVHECW